jgi:hypothetical protein
MADLAIFCFKIEENTVFNIWDYMGFGNVLKENEYSWIVWFSVMIQLKYWSGEIDKFIGYQMRIAENSRVQLPLCNSVIAIFCTK